MRNLKKQHNLSTFFVQRIDIGPGDAGERFVDILNTSPDEIAVISRLIAYLKMKREGE